MCWQNTLSFHTFELDATRFVFNAVVTKKNWILGLSCRLSVGLADVLPHLDLVALPFPEVSNSFQLARRAHNSSIRRRIGSVACLICSLTELCVTSLVEKSLSCESISSFCLCLNTLIFVGLSCLWVQFFVPQIFYCGKVVWALTYWIFCYNWCVVEISRIF